MKSKEIILPPYQKLLDLTTDLENEKFDPDQILKDIRKENDKKRRIPSVYIKQ